MKGEERAEVQIRDAVAVGDEKRFAGQQRRQSRDPAAGQGVLPGVHQMHRPFLIRRRAALDAAAGQIHRYIAGQSVPLRKPAFDHFAPVAESDRRFRHAVPGEVLQDVPEDRHAADLDHRLGADVCLFGQARPAPASQHDGFHALNRSIPRARWSETRSCLDRRA